MSYEKYPDIMELIEGNSLGILNLKLSITFSIFFFAVPFKILTLLSKYILLTLLLNSQILSGFFPKIVYLPLINPFSTDSNTKAFFSVKKLFIKFIISLEPSLSKDK